MPAILGACGSSVCWEAAGGCGGGWVHPQEPLLRLKEIKIFRRFSGASPRACRNMKSDPDTGISLEQADFPARLFRRQQQHHVLQPPPSGAFSSAVARGSWVTAPPDNRVANNLLLNAFPASQTFIYVGIYEKHKCCFIHPTHSPRFSISASSHFFPLISFSI